MLHLSHSYLPNGMRKRQSASSASLGFPVHIMIQGHPTLSELALSAGRKEDGDFFPDREKGVSIAELFMNRSPGPQPSGSSVTDGGITESEKEETQPVKTRSQTSTRTSTLISDFRSPTSKFRPVQYGGQAVIEGVMMRGPRESAIAVRLPDGQIEVTCQPMNSWSSRPFLKWPLVRGFVALIDSLIVGTKALTFSANRAVGEEEGEELSSGEMFLTVAVALGLGLLLFVGLPTGVAHLLQGMVRGAVWQNLLEGAIRLAVFLIYILAISRLKDIQRIFQYHGAEHKAIYTHEAGEELTVENARKFSTLHPRCGTSFLLIVVIISIFVFAFLGLDPLWWRLLSRVLLMPLVAGVAYEVLKFTARHLDSPAMRWLIAPGLWLQRLTTREPDDSQLEVALAALRKVLESGQELT